MRKKGSKNKVKGAKGAIKLTLKVNGQMFSATGDNFEDVIMKLKIGTPKTKGVLMMEKDGVVSKERYLFIPQMKRLFYPGMTGQVQRSILRKQFI